MMSDQPRAAEPDPRPSSCDEALALLWSYLDHELEQTEAERVRVHLSLCRGCFDEYEVEAVLKQVVQRGCAEHAPDHLRLRIHQQIIVWRTEQS